MIIMSEGANVIGWMVAAVVVFVGGKIGEINGVIIALCLVAIGWFLYGYQHKCWEKVCAVRDSLQNFNLELTQLSIDEGNLPDNYDSITERLREEANIATVWQEYAKTIVVVPDNNGNQKIFSTTEASQYLNEANFLSGINVNYWQNLGSVFTGIGILGTFIGLTIGLIPMMGSSLKNTAIVIESTQKLVNGLGTAFLTSIVGIIAAITFSVIHHKLMQSLQVEIVSFAQFFERVIPREPLEKWLALSYYESVEQTYQLKKFNTELALQIGQAVNEQIENGGMLVQLKAIEAKLVGVSEAFAQQATQPLPIVVEQVAQGIAQLNSSGGEAIRQEFAALAGAEIGRFAGGLETMNGKLEQVLTALTQTSSDVNKELAASIATTIKALTESVGTMRTEVAALTEKIGATGSAANEELRKMLAGMDEKLTEIMTQFAAQVESTGAQAAQTQSTLIQQVSSCTEDVTAKLKEQSAVLLGLEEKLGTITTEVATTMTKAQTAGDTFAHAATPLSTAVEGLTTNAAKLTNACDTYNSAVGKSVAELGVAAQNNLTAMTELRTGMDELDRQWQSHSEHFTSVSAELEKIIQNLEQGLKLSNLALTQSVETMQKEVTNLTMQIGTTENVANESLTKMLKATEQKFGQIVEQFARSVVSSNVNAVEAQRKLMEQVNTVTAQSVAQLQEQNKVVVSLQASLASITQQVADAMEEAQKAATTFATAADPISGAVEELSATSGKLTKACAAYNEAVGKSVAEVEAASSDNLATMDKLKEGISGMNRAWQSYSKHFEGVSGELSKIIETMKDGMEKSNQALYDSYVTGLRCYDDELSKACVLLRGEITSLHDALAPQPKAGVTSGKEQSHSEVRKS